MFLFFDIFACLDNNNDYFHGINRSQKSQVSLIMDSCATGREGATTTFSCHFENFESYQTRTYMEE